jgi:hypothetical protein
VDLPDFAGLERLAVTDSDGRELGKVRALYVSKAPHAGHAVLQVDVDGEQWDSLLTVDPDAISTTGVRAGFSWEALSTAEFVEDALADVVPRMIDVQGELPPIKRIHPTAPAPPRELPDIKVLRPGMSAD